MRTVSHSELRCYQRCPREHQHRYVDRVEPIVTAEALVRGRRIHTSLASWWSGSEWPMHGYSPADRAMLRGYAARYVAPHLRNVRVNVPFSVEIGGVRVVGELDAIGEDPETGRTVIPEHKTTSSDITPGSLYWRQVVHTDAQVSTYLSAFPGATVLYDVLRKPSFRKLRDGKPNEETDDEFEARCLEAMSEAPEKYFQRATIVRLEEDTQAFRLDVVDWTDAMAEQLNAPRNTSSCFAFGRPCDFFDVCFAGRSLDAPEYRRVPLNHTEQVESKLIEVKP